jgi:hypothetical protein
MKHRVDAARYSAAARRCPSRDARARSSTTKPRVACPAGRADAVESAPSRPLRSAARRARVARVRWHPTLRRMNTWMPPLSSSLSQCRCTDKHNSCALHLAPFCRCASAPREHAHSAAVPSRHLLFSLMV